jgi:hypothetical protein
MVPTVPGLTEMLEPVPAEATPQAVVYHFHVPLEPVWPPLTDKVALSPTQMVVGEAVTEVGAIPVSLMVMVLDIQTVLLHPPMAFRYIVCDPVPNALVVNDNESLVPRPT